MADSSCEFAREWLDKALRDRRAAEVLLAAEPPMADLAAFHCPQAVEKTLKGFLTFHGRVFGKTHDLGRVCKQCADVDSAFDEILQRADTLSEYAVDYRYPGPDQPTIENPHEALAIADLVWTFVLDRLPESLRESYA